MPALGLQIALHVLSTSQPLSLCGGQCSQLHTLAAGADQNIEGGNIGLAAVAVHHLKTALLP